MVRWLKDRRRGAELLAVVAFLGGCRPAKGGSELVIAATGEPSTLVPPLISETVGRDIADLVYERLATLGTGRAPIDTSAFVPGLAARWERVDSLAWRFTLRRDATWHDGRPVTADDVAFSFAAYADTSIGAPAGTALAGVTVTAEAPDRVLIRFPRPGPEQLFDATWHVRVMPSHVWSAVARATWGADTSLARLVGSGPYRIAEWRRGQALVAERVRGDGFPRIAWRFAGDQDAALNLALAGEADVVETVTSPDARERARRDSTVSLIPYPSAVYGFVGFRLADGSGRPHPILGDRAVRQALARAVDRAQLVKAVIGPDAAVPSGPMSRALWLWDDAVHAAPADPASANGLLDAAGWVRGPGGLRRRGGKTLTVDLLVPSSSGARRQLAEGIQQMWRAVGVVATITAVDFAVFQERLGQGRFDAMIGAWLDEPSPRSLADQWTRAGFGVLNYGRYANPVFDSLFHRALTATAPAAARPLWREAFDTLTADAPAIFLYTPTNVAVVSKRLGTPPIDPFAWLNAVERWRKAP